MGLKTGTAKMEELEIVSFDAKGCGATGGDRDGAQWEEGGERDGKGTKREGVWERSSEAENGSQGHLWPVDSWTHLPLRLVHHPFPLTSTPVSGPDPPLATPSRKPAVPRLARHPLPLLAPHGPVVRRRRGGGGAGSLGWGIPAPSPVLPQPTLLRSPHSQHRAGKQREWGRKRGPGDRGEHQDQEVGEGIRREGEPKADREPKAGGCQEPEPEGGWRQPRGR